MNNTNYPQLAARKPNQINLCVQSAITSPLAANKRDFNP